MATKYRLTSEALRVVQSDDKGKVTYRKRYKKGQTVDVSKMDEERFNLFVKKGYLVDADAPVPEDDEPETATESDDDYEPSEGATENAVEVPEGEYEDRLVWVSEGEDEDERKARASALFAHEKDTDPDFVEGDVASDLHKAVYGEQEEKVVDYADLTYPELQQAAKARDLNAGGSADDIRARLVEDDAAKQS